MHLIQIRVGTVGALLLVIFSGMMISVRDLPAQAKVKKLASAKIENAEEKQASDIAKALKRSKASDELFSPDVPLEISLSTDIKRIRSDKGETAPWRTAVISYVAPSGKVVATPTQIRTRGIWRLKNCMFPPLKLNFKSEVAKGTLFQGLDKPKMVNFCRDTDEYEQYVIQEMQLYRIYNLLTPASHRARLLRVSYQDSATGKLHARRLALLVEEAEVMAARIGGPVIDIQGAVARDLEPFHDALIGFFQYFIGNTDFSIYALHNVELVRLATGDYLPVPYDFDFAGAINASYATTDPKLPITRVRDRLFKGYCHSQEDYAKAIARFNEKKADIYALYSDSIGKMLKPKIAQQTLEYFDDFYKTVNDPGKLRREVTNDCVKTG